MKKEIKNYFDNLKSLLDRVIVTDGGGRSKDFYGEIEATAGLLLEKHKDGNKVMLIGNGASAAISSHVSADLLKNAGIKATAFNDPSALTCISNDCGYETVFEKQIEMFARSGDVLFAISSSGRSANIIRGVDMARSRDCRVVTFSGFKEDNPLRLLGEVNFYVPASEYGEVEVVHHAICHSIVDSVIANKRKKGQ